MGIEQVANKYKKNEKDPSEVWSNIELDALRRTDCLCVNCDRKNDAVPYSSCKVASQLYQISVHHNMAMAITRCGAVDENGNLMYEPLKEEKTS